MAHSGIDYKVDNTKLQDLRNALTNAGIEYMITRRDGVVVHINAWVGKEEY
jgi:outer membrane protein W